MSTGYGIISSPNWPLEVVNFLLEIKMEREKEVIKNHKSFGKTEEEMLQFFKPYLDYKEVLKNEILPIYKEYPKLEIAFRLDDEDNTHDQPDLVRYTTKIEDEKYRRPLTDEEASKIVEDAILDVLRTSFVELEDNAEIRSLSHLIELLESVEKTAEQKLQIISLYENRCEFMREFQEFIKRAIPIFKAHYPIISKDVNMALKKLEQMEDLKSTLWKIFSTKPIDAEEIIIRIGIFSFNQLSAEYDENILEYTVGIYFFLLDELKEKYGTQLDALVTDLKAIADNTRLNIMYSLAKEPMYIQQLAEELNLTPATISHHIDVLLKSELISITMDVEKSKKIYYEVNKEKLKTLARNIESIGERSNMDGKTDKISIL